MNQMQRAQMKIKMKLKLRNEVDKVKAMNKIYVLCFIFKVNLNYLS